MKTHISTLTALMLIITLTVSVSSAAITTNTFYVSKTGTSESPYATWTTAATNIQDAVDQADAAYVKDQTNGLVRVAAGHYLLSKTLSITNNPLILLNDAGRDETLIDGQGTIQTMDINADCLVDSLTITNGYRGGTLQGGNILLTKGVVRNCRITGGQVSGFGGGIALLGTATRLENCLVAGNRGGQGGGIMISAGVAIDCIISNNISASYFQRGGGVLISGGTIDRCLIADNRGGEGAGIKLNGGTAQNCLIIGNRADISPFNGGGVFQENGILQNCTVVGNSAALAGGGIYQNGNNARVRNSITYFNSATTADNLYRVSGWLENSCTFPEISDDAKASGNTAIDPEFANRFGGDYQLLPGSPAIDTGSATGAPTYDYVGHVRPLDGSGTGTPTVDMGALEAPAFTAPPLRCNAVGLPTVGFNPLSVVFNAYVAGADTTGMHYAWDFGDGHTLAFSTNTEVTHGYTDYGLFDVTLSASNALGQASMTKPAYINVAPETVYVSPSGSHTFPFSNWNTAATNLQDAVDAALNTPDIKSRVLVGNGTYLLNKTLTIDKNITIESENGAQLTILDGGGSANTYRAVFIGAGEALFRGFTVSNSVTTDPGAGIYLQGGAVRDCAVVNNRTTGAGGGIYMASGTSVSNCLVRGNRIEAAQNGAGVSISGDSLLEDCEVRANQITSSGMGAGVSIASAGSIVRNCWINNNTNHYRGGGVSVSGGTLEDCVIEANNAADGGGIFSDLGKIYRNRFVHNYGRASGGAAFLRTSSIFRNNLVVGNQSLGAGGGICVQHGSGQLVENNTVTGNYAGTYGGGISQDTGAITNTIMWGNSAGTSGNDFVGTITNISTSCASGLKLLNGNINTDPLFAKPGSGVGLTHVISDFDDYHLKADSPCAKTGTVIPWMIAAADLDGTRRIIKQGFVSMGAYEKLIAPLATVILIR